MKPSILLAILLAAVYAVSAIPASADSIPRVGDVYRLKTEPLCVDDFHAFDAISSALVAKDKEGAEQAFSQHSVSIATGTHVRILNVDIFRSDVDVRVISEGSSHYGERIYCFVPPNSGGQPQFSRVLQRIGS